MMRPTSKARGEFARNRKGATAIEYGLIAALIALGLIGALRATGQNTSNTWAGNSDSIGQAMQDAG